MANPPAERSARVAAFLQKVRSQPRARLIFALDATASRQPTWDMACSLQAEMFSEVGKLGGLEIQLVYYRGLTECLHSAWTTDAGELARAMSRIMCVSGTTQIRRVLEHVRGEHLKEPVAAVIFVGDAVEETPGSLYDAAAGLPPLFLFQEGRDVEVAVVLKTLAERTHGAHCRFDAGAARQLGELLKAVAVFAAGGLTALADLRSDSARKLLAQMRGK